jgi:hypothetical protein
MTGRSDPGNNRHGRPRHPLLSASSNAAVLQISVTPLPRFRSRVFESTHAPPARRAIGWAAADRLVRGRWEARPASALSAVRHVRTVDHGGRPRCPGTGVLGERSSLLPGGPRAAGSRQRGARSGVPCSPGQVFPDQTRSLGSTAMSQARLDSASSSDGRTEGNVALIGHAAGSRGSGTVDHHPVHWYFTQVMNQ